jgi:nucleotide-binding universal stress UspA family protein
MKWIENILVAVDVSRNEHPHLEDAAKLALREQATITLLTVLPKEAQNPSLKNLVEQYATDVLEKLRQSLVAQGVREVHTCCDYGDVAQSIINSAERTGADLVVLYEKHSDTKHLISEVVKKTIRLSSVPVWTTLKGANSEIKKILCPVDCSAASKSALSLALRLASIYGASVHVLYVFEPITHVPTLVKVNLEEINRDGKKTSRISTRGVFKRLLQAGLLNGNRRRKGDGKNFGTSFRTRLTRNGNNGRTGLSRIVMEA